MRDLEFLNEILQYIKEKDLLHYKKIKANTDMLASEFNREFQTFLGLLVRFFDEKGLSASQVSEDYLKMVNDMRVEGIYFKKHRQYSCANQHEAYVNVYSRPEIMNYYMNALLLSQILWTHHFKMLMFFSEQLEQTFLKNTKSVLDIGPGHGFFSSLVISKLSEIEHIDIVDISDGSLAMTKAIIGDGGGKIKYFNRDIFTYESNEKYDLIILGEVLEHLDEPLLILKKLSSLLSENGYLWLTTPTNAPALDHVYLFRSREEIIGLLQNAGLDIHQDFGCFAENVPDEMAKKFDISYLYGAFLKN